GTTIRLVFPAVESTVTESAPGRPPGAGRVGAGTVRVVEDERGVREVFRRALAEAGYRVYSAETGSEAVERFVSRVAEIDLLVTDLVMPGIGGVELARTLLRAKPGLRVLLVSGYAELDADPRRADWPAGAEFLAKPFEPEELVTKVAAQLSSQPPEEGAPAAERIRNSP
ncbi:MAG: response regulator, partial [Gemmatimonadales bacterium]